VWQTHKSRDSSAGIATGYGLDNRMIGVRFQAGSGNHSLRHRVQTSSGAHPTSYPVDTGSSFPGGKAAGEWSRPLTSECRAQRMRGTTSPLHQYVFMGWCLVKQRWQTHLCKSYICHIPHPTSHQNAFIHNEWMDIRNFEVNKEVTRECIRVAMPVCLPTCIHAYKVRIWNSRTFFFT
jgi:hypothetical protein